MKHTQADHAALIYDFDQRGTGETIAEFIARQHEAWAWEQKIQAIVDLATAEGDI